MIEQKGDIKTDHNSPTPKALPDSAPANHNSEADHVRSVAGKDISLRAGLINATLTEVRRVFHGDGSHANAKDTLAMQAADRDFAFLRVSNIWHPGDKRTSLLREGDKVPLDNPRPQEDSDTAPRIGLHDGSVEADGKVAGKKVHATVDGRQATVTVEDGPSLKVDKAGHSSDYTSPEWHSHVMNGKGEIVNEKTGNKIIYDGHQLQVRDKDNHVLAESSDPNKMLLHLPGLKVHTGEQPDAKAEQKRLLESNSDRTEIYQHQKTGDWTAINRDAIVSTNRAERLVDITGKDGRTLRVRKAQDGSNHFSELVNGKEEALTAASEDRFKQAGIDFDRQKSTVTLNGKQLVDASLNLQLPGESQTSAQITAENGDLIVQDQKGQEVAHITRTASGQCRVHTPQFDWMTGQGFSVTGSDDSKVTADASGFHIAEANGNKADLGWHGEAQIRDMNGRTFFNVDKDGNTSFWGGKGVTSAGQVYGTDGGGGISGGNETSYQQAQLAAQNACASAAGMLSQYEAQMTTGAIMPGADAALASLNNDLTSALATCLSAHNLQAASDVMQSLAKVAAVQGSMSKPLKEAQLLADRGIGSPYLCKQAQALTGVTAEQAAARIERMAKGPSFITSAPLAL